MAFYDVVLLYEDAFEESKGGKDRGTFSINRTLLAKSNSRNPSFVEIGNSTASWPGLNGDSIDQLNSLRSFDGILARCASRKFSWYTGSEHGVQIDLTYEGLSEYVNSDSGGSQQPRTLETNTWRRISISTSQISQPATDEEGRGFCNSAGDPVDGLEEESAIGVLKYTNEFNPNPNLAGIWDWLNTCNKNTYLGAKAYTLRVTGFSAEFDDKTMLWKTSLELTYNPKTWKLTYYDTGMHEIVAVGAGFERRVIKDKLGNTVNTPVPLDGEGGAADVVGPPEKAPDRDDFRVAEPVSLSAKPYPEKNFDLMLSELRMY